MKKPFNVRSFWRQMFIAAIVFFFHAACYLLAGRLIDWLNLPPHFIGLSIDHAIPLVSVFVFPYVAWYLYLFIGYYLLARNRQRIQRFALAIFVGAITCMAIFLLFPTSIDRPAVPEGGLANMILGIVYWVDTPAYNLFPSLHVFVSWLFFAQARALRPARPWLIVLSLGFALLTCASVLFIRQHFILDIPAGILLAEACWALSRWGRLQRLTDWFWNWAYKEKTICDEEETPARESETS